MGDIFLVRRSLKHRQSMLMHCFIFLVTAVRQYGIVILVLASCPLIVLHIGSDIMSILFNTVAVLFVLQIDDLIFDKLLSAETLKEIQCAAALGLDQSNLRTAEQIRISAAVLSFTAMI